MPENLRSVAEPLLAALPIASLVWMMTKKNSLPAWQALPLSAALLYAIKLLCFQNSVWQLNAAALSGVLYAFTPLLIAFGAILLFLTMEATGCMNAIRIWLSGISDDRTAELMLIGWAFVFLIEGASGFGTPAALAAPLLVGLGFKPVKTAVFCLMANSISVPFGAVGVPTWFGLSAAGLDKAQMLQVSFDSALIQFVAALFVIPLAVGLTLGFDDVKRKFVFIILSTLSCTLPFLVLARFNYEFPSLLGGGIGLLATCYLARRKIGLGKELAEDETSAPPQKMPLRPSLAFFPLWGCVALLLLTRIDFIGLKRLLLLQTPVVDVSLGGLGEFSASPSLLLKLTHIFGTEISWEMKALYIPALIPFVVISACALLLFRPGAKASAGVFKEAFSRVRLPGVALFGALALVGLLMAGGENSCAMSVGRALAKMAGHGWILCAPFLGALGAFFAGSSTVSNLTFSGIQQSIAHSLSIDQTIVLALQSSGSSMGTLVSINNIVAVSAVLGIPLASGGIILKATFWTMMMYGAIAAAMGFLLLQFA